MNELTADQAAVLEALPAGRDDARLLSQIRRPFGLSKTRHIVWELHRLGYARFEWCGTYGDNFGYGQRYRRWFRVDQEPES